MTQTQIILILISLFVLFYSMKIPDDEIDHSEAENTEEKDPNRKFLGFNAETWGWISVFTNGFSVVFQMANLIKTRTAQSFSMPFIFLMTVLNAVYCIIGLLILNWGLAIATFFFVVYNLTVVYYYYYGVQTRKIKNT